MFSVILEQLLAPPDFPRWIIAPFVLFLPFIQPLLSLLQDARSAALVHVMAVMVSGAEFVVEIIRRLATAGSLRSQVNLPRASRQRLDDFLRYFVDSVRLLIICLAMATLGFSLLVGLVTLYALYCMIWGRQQSIAAASLQVFRNLVFGKDLFAGTRFDPTQRYASAADSAAATSHATGGDEMCAKVKEQATKSRKTSLKSGSAGRCLVADEGPLFNKTSRGCLLGV